MKETSPSLWTLSSHQGPHLGVPGSLQGLFSEGPGCRLPEINYVALIPSDIMYQHHAPTGKDTESGTREPVTLLKDSTTTPLIPYGKVVGCWPHWVRCWSPLPSRNSETQPPYKG